MDQRLGQQIGNYRIVQKLAEGGFGSVYVAEHFYISQRYAAIKFMKSYLGSGQEQEQFRQEAEILERLNHKYVLKLHDFGFEEGYPYLVTPYATCGSLQQLITEHADHYLDLTEALRILKQTGQALRYVHHHQIIHRDLKPENILFNEDRNVQLADFGIATIIRTTSMMSATVGGTPAYMAPEQYRGQVSRATDQYALGCIAYELLTGHKVFVAESPVHYMYKHMQEEPTPVRKINSAISTQIEDAIQIALAKDPMQRHSSIEAFLHALGIHLPQETYLPAIEDLPANVSPSEGPLAGSTLLRPTPSSPVRETDIETVLIPKRSKTREASIHEISSMPSSLAFTTPQVSHQAPFETEQRVAPPVIAQKKRFTIPPSRTSNYLFLAAGLLDLLLVLSGFWWGLGPLAQIGIALAIGICVCGTALNFFIKPWIWMVTFLFSSVLVGACYWLYTVILGPQQPTLQHWQTLFGYLLLAPLPGIAFGLFGPEESRREPIDVEFIKKLILTLWLLGLGLALAAVVMPVTLPLGVTWMFATGIIAVGQVIRLKEGQWLTTMLFSLAFVGISAFFFGLIYGIGGPTESNDKLEFPSDF